MFTLKIIYKVHGNQYGFKGFRFIPRVERPHIHRLAAPFTMVMLLHFHALLLSIHVIYLITLSMCDTAYTYRTYILVITMYVIA